MEICQSLLLLLLSTNETKGPAEAETFVKKAKKYTIMSAYMNIKKNNLVCATKDGMPLISQKTKCTGLPRQMLFAKCLSEFVSKSFKKL